MFATEESELVLDTVDRDRREASGRAIRDRVKRSDHALLPPRPVSFDVIEVLDRASVDRVPALVPIRHHRMAVSPFSFFRGTANLMAIDLAHTPVSGIDVQLCGDAHCANFGAFATPERNVIFDVRDFDETLVGPWEWDLKRLAASLVLAVRDIGGDGKAQQEAVSHAVARYRANMRESATKSTLDVWYSRVDVSEILEGAGDKAIRKRRRTYVDGVGRRTVRKAYDDLTEASGTSRRFVDEEPLVYHPERLDAFFDIEAVFGNLRQSMHTEIRELFDRYRLVDWVKVVGVGSVGTRCAAALFLAHENDPLILQIKEAGASVLEAHLRPSPFVNHGERVVTGQRTMQAASDMFLGWTTAGGRDYYVRQLRDMKGVPDLEDMGDGDLVEFAGFCGWTLGAAHARSGRAAQTAGYLGKSTTFDEAIVAFALAYADRVETDHEAIVGAIASGRLSSKEA